MTAINRGRVAFVLSVATILAACSATDGGVDEIADECVFVDVGDFERAVVTLSVEPATGVARSPWFEYQHADGTSTAGGFTGPMPEHGMALADGRSAIAVVQNAVGEEIGSESCRLSAQHVAVAIPHYDRSATGEGVIFDRDGLTLAIEPADGPHVAALVVTTP